MQHGYVHKMWLIQHFFDFSITRKRAKNKTHEIILIKVRIVPLSTTGIKTITFNTNENCVKKNVANTLTHSLLVIFITTIKVINQYKLMNHTSNKL